MTKDIQKMEKSSEIVKAKLRELKNIPIGMIDKLELSPGVMKILKELHDLDKEQFTFFMHLFPHLAMTKDIHVAMTISRNPNSTNPYDNISLEERKKFLKLKDYGEKQ